MSKIIILGIICSFALSCNTVSMSDYETQEEEQFTNMTLERIEDYTVSNAQVFMNLRNTWDSYLIVWYIFYPNDIDILPSLNLSKISIKDVAGNIIFSRSNIDIYLDKNIKLHKKYQEKHGLYAASLTEEIPLETIIEDKYYVIFEINGKEIKETLMKKTRTYMIMR